MPWIRCYVFKMLSLPVVSLLSECLLTDVEADGLFSGSSDVKNERVPTHVFVVTKQNVAANNTNN